MTYLLDVNALIALGFVQHTHRGRLLSWLHATKDPSLATCSIVELGFVRVLSQTSAYAFDVASARHLLAQVKATSKWPLEFIADDQGVAGLPNWVKLPSQTTDGHLVQLAGAHGCMLATLDSGIPGAHLIP